MAPNELFQAALQLAGTPWRVVSSTFNGEPAVLEIHLDFTKGSEFSCPPCGELCGVHDTTGKRWRHLNFFQYRCELVARVPRVWCRQDGVHLIAKLPWASSSSGFTLLFEAFVMLLAEQMPVAAIARLVDEADTRFLTDWVNFLPLRCAFAASDSGSIADSPSPRFSSYWLTPMHLIRYNRAER